MFYTSTRNNSIKITASQAILKGLSDEGGLFVPEEFPKLSVDLETLADMSYKEVAYTVMKDFLSDFTEEELKYCIDNAYDSKFDTEEIAPLVEAEGTYYLELFHGKTIAFKDMALSILPYLLTTAAKKNDFHKEIVILTATSGDTGKAALAGFADVKGIRIMVFYPKGGVSKIQELQMLTQQEKNTCVYGVKGNFDDCQTAVKELFNDEALMKEMDEKGFAFSSANSINIGRLVPQVAYYVYAYAKLVKEDRILPGEKINFCVPTGNFGNILAGFYAKNMGLPINKLICASNENKVLFDFFKTGEYDKNRDFVLTKSPSMDILISSNLERLIYLLMNRDSEKLSALMKSLKETGSYDVKKELEAFNDTFVGEYSEWSESAKKIHDLYEDTGYVIDTHTAVAAAALDKYVHDTKDHTKTVVVSTASPFKFGPAVMSAIDKKYEGADALKLLDELSKLANVEKPNAIKEILSLPIKAENVCEIKEMKSALKKELNL